MWLPEQRTWAPTLLCPFHRQVMTELGASSNSEVRAPQLPAGRPHRGPHAGIENMAVASAVLFIIQSVSPSLIDWRMACLMSWSGSSVLAR
jgi:hypothetical protein